MYLAGVRSGARLSASTVRRVAVGNVVALGTVSLFTDISAEMVTAVLPAYLVLSLHLSVAQYGLLDGLYTGATALTRLLGGYLADRFAQRKLVALVGYGLSAVSKLGLLLAANAPAAIGTVIAVDRTGKGIRTAPRDALIAGEVAEPDLGAAFGLHRAMDSVGAFLGPLAALGVLALGAADGYGSVFVGSFGTAMVGLVVLTLFVRNRPGMVGEQVLDEPRVGSLRPLVGLTAFRRLCLVAALLGLATVGDGFVYLVLQHRHGLSPAYFPLLAVGTSLAFLVLALPLGRLADRVGRWPVVVSGYAALLVVYVLLASGVGPIPLVLALYGLFYAATDGVLAALAVPLLPERLRTTGLAMLQSGQALAYFASSIAFGVLWQYVGLTPACLVAAGSAALVLPLGALLLRRRPEPGADR